MILLYIDVTRGPREVAESRILGDLGRSPTLKYYGDLRIVRVIRR